MTTISAPRLTGVVCWTRMQSEAGQDIGSIIARKEIERRAGDGLFYWGVGNAPNRAVRRLAAQGEDVDVVFSLMKGRPAAQDAAPEGVVAWRTCYDSEGVECRLPPHVLVTSRMDTDSGVKAAHYALVCRSDDGLVLGDMGAFDPSAYRNVGDAGGAVGSSQVTALVVRTRSESPVDGYRVNLRAKLVGGFWVKLGSPRVLGAGDRRALAAASARAGAMETAEWGALLAEIRQDPEPPVSGQMLLF